MPARSNFKALNDRIAEAKIWQGQCGSINPRPPGVSSLAIQSVKKAMARGLRWYMRPFAESDARIITILEEMTQRLESQQEHLYRMERETSAALTILQSRWEWHENRILENEKLSALAEISPSDGMFVGDVDHYFSVGASALRCIRLALNAAGKQKCEAILDLPCGYGRVLRFLKAVFPDAQLTACDVLRDGVDFCAAAFGAIPVYADEDPARTNIRGPFDLIWCGSLLTHLNKERWDGFLRFFEDLLSPGGILVFTVHGRRTVRYFQEGSRNYGLEERAVQDVLDSYRHSGFGYANYKDGPNYGISVSSPAWVLSQHEQHPNLRLLTYLEEGWDSHQDVISSQRVG